MDLAAVCLALLLSTLSLLFFFMRCRISLSSTIRLPPGSLGFPVVGQTLQLLKAMRDNRGEEWFAERAQRFGPISKLHVLGKPTVLLQGQTANKWVYTADENTLSSELPASPLRIFGERNIAQLKGEDHKRVRRAFLSFMNPEALKQSVGKMAEEIRLHLHQHWHHNNEIQVTPLMKTLTFNVICTLMLGIERGARRDKLLVLLAQMVNGLVSLPINLPFTRFHTALRARSKATEIIIELVHEKRRDSITNHPDFITSLLNMCDDEIVDICVAAMIGGYESTSSLLSVLIKLLSENPQVYETVFKEQREIARGKAAGELLTWDDLTKMKYTWKVATEALRMYQPPLFTLRRVLKDIEMEGYTIPRGWQVIMVGCMTHMDESIFPNPHNFNPSRYDDNGAIRPFTFVAFGGGPRMCVGYEFAKAETLIMIHYLITTFRWKLSLEENLMTRDPMITFKKGLPIKIERLNMI